MPHILSEKVLHMQMFKGAIFRIHTEQTFDVVQRQLFVCYTLLLRDVPLTCDTAYLVHEDE